MIFPLGCLAFLSVLVIGARYQSMLRTTKSHKSFEFELAKIDAETSLSTEAQAMRKYYLGLITVTQFEEVKSHTQKSLVAFSDLSLKNQGKENILDREIMVPLSNLRSDVLSGQKRWPEVKEKMNQLNLRLSEIALKNSPYPILSSQAAWLKNYELLQKTYSSAGTFRNDISYTVLRDMPLNSDQFSSLVRSLERADFFREKIKTNFTFTEGSFGFFIGQQSGLWKRVLNHYNQVRGNVGQGRYGVSINKMIATFDKYQLAIAGGIQAYKKYALGESEKILSGSRRTLIWNCVFLSLFILVSTRLSISLTRRALFYLATEMTGHDIKIISKNGGRRSWSKKVILLSDYQNTPEKESAEQKKIA